MTQRSLVAWYRLTELLQLVETYQELGFLSAEETKRLKHLACDIIKVKGGTDIVNPTPELMNDPASGALATHAFAVVSRELIPQDAAWAPLIEQIKENWPSPPGPGR